MELTTITPTPTQLKALTHPARLRMLGLLRAEGPATATTLAARLGLNTGASSYHLRQLAQHGFVVEDTELGNARDRWWRAAHQATHADTLHADPADQEVADAYLQTVVVMQTERLQQAMEERSLHSLEWLDASTFSDWGFTLTPKRAKQLIMALKTLATDWAEDEGDPDAGDFVLQLSAFPRPGVVAREPEGDDAD